MAFSVSRILKLGTFLLIFLVGFSYTADAQSRTKKKSDVDEYFDEEGFGPHRFWFGAGLQLPGFSSFGGNSRFQFSLSPMAGYKLTPGFSVGIRTELGFEHQRTQGQSSVNRTNFWNYGIGGFARHKIFNRFFIHGEYQLESARVSETFNGVTNSARGSRDNMYIGAGYVSGGGNSPIWYEISILCTVFDDNITTTLPIDYRLAYTYNF